jgi:chemotaxis methyl-accepting protein methylase
LPEPEPAEPRGQRLPIDFFFRSSAQGQHERAVGIVLSGTGSSVERRMAGHQIDGIDGYVKYLQKTPAEVEAMFRDLLIGVTNFFRDPDAFVALRLQ